MSSIAFRISIGIASFQDGGLSTIAAFEDRVAVAVRRNISVTDVSARCGWMKANEPRKVDRAWFCAIEDYVEFPQPVAASRDGRYFEDITRALGWQVGIRPITEVIYQDILAAAGKPVNAAPTAGNRSACGSCSFAASNEPAEAPPDSATHYDHRLDAVIP